MTKILLILLLLSKIKTMLRGESILFLILENKDAQSMIE